MQSLDEQAFFHNFHTFRRQLLPWWIKAFCWFFMVFGAVALVCLCAGLLGYSASLALYGFETTAPLSPVGILLISLALFKGYSAYQLWFEKDNAITIGRIDAIIGIVLCIISMFVVPFFQDAFKLTFRLELALLFPYCFKLNRIETDWQAAIPTGSLPLPAVMGRPTAALSGDEESPGNAEHPAS